MPIIGKLIERSTAFSYKQNLKKKLENNVQLQLLKKHLTFCRNTQFGMTYGFTEILSSADFYADFKQRVPISTYDEFYPWIEKCLNDKRDIIFPGRIKYFALSSGTTGAPSKRIPVTSQMIRSFQKATLRQFTSLHAIDFDRSFYASQFLTVGGSVKLTKQNKHFEGDLSGILRKHAPIVAKPFTKPGKRISKERDWNEKLELMVLNAQKMNIGTIAGVPSWCILLMERIVEHYKVESIHDIWPNLQLYLHGGVFMKPYENRLRRILGNEIVLLDTYLASEGYFGFQTHPSRKGMQLLLNTGVIYEFIPFNTDYFDAEGSLRNRHDSFSIDEVQPEMDYALVISTNAGLWRYLIGDLIQFTDIENREIKISGRIKQYLSLCGEHLSLDNINNALQQVSIDFNIEITEFTIVAHEEELFHHWYIGVDQQVSQNELIHAIDKAVCKLNDDYSCSRKVNLKPPQITLLSSKLFYDFLKSLGKNGGQNKFPRVMNAERGKDWVEFLER